jgi:hypothetical protein
MTSEPDPPALTKEEEEEEGSLGDLLEDFTALLVRVCTTPESTPRSLLAWLESRDVETRRLALLRSMPCSRGIDVSSGSDGDWFALTHVQRWFFGLDLRDPSHFNQTVLLRAARPVQRPALAAALDVVAAKHPALRHRFGRAAGGPWMQREASREECGAGGASGLSVIEVATTETEGATSGEAGSSPLALAVLALHKSLDLGSGPLFRAAVVVGLDAPERPVVVVVVHHLVMDGISQVMQGAVRKPS